MRSSIKTSRKVVVVACLVGLAAVALAGITQARAVQGAVDPGDPGREGKGLIVGDIVSFDPSSVGAGHAAFTLWIHLDSAISAAPSWTVGFGSASLSAEASTTAAVRVTVPASEVDTAGPVSVFVSDGTTAWNGVFTVTSGAPVVTSIVPDVVAAYGNAFTLRVNGSNFATGSSPAYVTLDGVALVPASGDPVNPTAVLFATVTKTMISTVGTHSIRVVNPAPGGGVESNARTLTVSGPVFTAVTPSTGANTNSALTIELTGTDLNLASSPIVRLKGADTGNAAATITAANVTYVPPPAGGTTGTIRGTLNLANPSGGTPATPAPAGKYDVTLVFNQDGEKSLTRAMAFEVTGPSITAVTPATASNGSTNVLVTLTGTGLFGLTSPTVTLKGPGTSGSTIVTGTGVSATADGTTMTCAFNLASPTVTQAGKYDVVIMYAGNKTVTKAQTFDVTNAVPVVTAINPATTWAGSVKPTTLAVTGSGFVPVPSLLGAVGSKVQIGARLTSDTTFLSTSQLTVPLLTADVPVAGTVPIAVVNPAPGGGTSATVPLVVMAETTTPITTISGADTRWHRSPVTLTVTATDAQSGVQTTQWALNGGAPQTLVGSTITIGTVAQGAQTVTVWSTDWCNRVEQPAVSAVVKIDSIGPVTYVSAPSSATRGARIAFKYRADDVSPKCSIVLKIKKSGGSVARAYELGKKPSKKTYTYAVNPNLAKGTYKVYCYAKDEAGNTQSELDSQAFKIK